MIKKFSIALSLIFVIGILGFIINHTSKVHAQTADKITGYAWSTNIGWIRMNCENSVNDNTCSSVQYGVEVDHDTGILSGYAWSSVVGWISFENASGCPAISYFNSNSNNNGGNCYARALFSAGSGGPNIVGWARVVAGPQNNSCTNGACGEWISLSCLNTATSSNTNGYCTSSNHKVTYPNDGGYSLDKDGGPLSGYAYGSGGASVGWLDMSKVIWNISDSGLFCDKYPSDPRCLEDLYIKATNTPNSGYFDVGINPGIDLEYGSKKHTVYYDKCVASTDPVSTGTKSWTGSKVFLDSNNSWTYNENSVRVPYPNTSGKVRYIITCPTDSTHDVSASTEVDVTMPTWTLGITANGSTGSTTISNGGSATIVWTATNAPSGTTCSAPIWAPGQTGTNVTTSIGNITNSATYSVTCTPPAGSLYEKTASVQVKVVKVTSFPQIGCFQSGSSPVLTWSSDNAATCSMAVPGGSVVSSLPAYSNGKSFTEGAGQYTLTCKDSTGAYTSGGNNSISVTQCIPNFSINSTMSCNGNPNANGGIITDNAFQKFTSKTTTTYVAKIPVSITPQTGFTSDVSYTFLKPLTTPWSNISVKWASGSTGNTVVKTNSGGYADTLILTASSLADVNALFTGVSNGYQGITVQAQRVNSTPAQLKPNPPVFNFSVCAPGGGGVKPIFIES